jgi:hypothetical protein
LLFVDSELQLDNEHQQQGDADAEALEQHAEILPCAHNGMLYFS